jgi:hypothetical protein
MINSVARSTGCTAFETGDLIHRARMIEQPDRLRIQMRQQVGTAAFNVFLYGRMIGAAAEIDDHLNRGRNMDTRTPQEQCGFVV